MSDDKILTEGVDEQGVRRDGIIKVVAGERFTPLTLARKLDAQVILESSSFQKGRERYSILMVKEAFRVLQKDDTITLNKDGKKFAIQGKSKDILDVLMYFAHHPQAPSPHEAFHQDEFLLLLSGIPVQLPSPVR